MPARLDKQHASPPPVGLELPDSPETTGPRSLDEVFEECTAVRIGGRTVRVVSGDAKTGRGVAIRLAKAGADL